MLRFFRSNDLRLLANRLLEEFREYPPANPLTPELFVVQNHGMARWLSLFIAENEGIAANLQFKFPAELFWQLIRIMQPGIAEILPSERLPMTWAIFYILQHDKDQALAELHTYVNRSDPQKQEIRCWNLACRIADVFDQYLTYRPEMILEWEKSDYQQEFFSAGWQPVLWKKLMNHWHGKGKKKWSHRADLQKKLLQKLDHQSISEEKLPPRISIFGVSEMPPVYLKTFLKLSKCTDVHLYLRNDTNSTDNALVESLGRAGGEFESLIQKFLKSDNKIIPKTEKVELSQGTTSTLFSMLKQDLLTTGEPSVQAQADRSLQVHSCHSPRREVEVLYDQLLKMLDDDRSLNPSDIMVLCPKMEDYAPEIRAVFGAVEEKIPQIPFHLTESNGPSQIVFSGFQKLLELVDSRFKVTDVLDLLDCRPVRRAFGFDEEEVSMLESWIGETRIRWGINGQQKSGLGLPESDRFTWQSGLHRMFSGYAMESEGDQLFDGKIYPYGEIQRSEQARLLGRFSELLHQLFSIHQEVKTAKNSEKWREKLGNWISLLFIEEEPYARGIQILEETVSTVVQQTQRANFDGEISFQILRSFLNDQIDRKGTGGGRPGPGVTFSLMVPMRNIPAKVICLIGINDGTFPRAKKGVEFDLIAQNPQPGDRQASKDDRQLFWEELMAAQQQIYFSYIGHSNRKDVNFPPSIILRELLDFINEQYKIYDNKIIQHHRLHGFSSTYFKNNSQNLFSYSVRNKNIAQRLSKPIITDKLFFPEALPEPDDALKTFSIGELISFFQHPAKFFFQQRLGVNLRADEVLDEDREAFELSALEKYQIGQELLNRYMDEESTQSFQKVAEASNLLPDGWAGNRAFAQEEHKAREFGAVIKAMLQQEKIDNLEVELEIGDFLLSGQLDQIYEGEQILYRFGKCRPKDIIELWIKHLILQLTKSLDHPGQSRLFTEDRYKPYAVIKLPPLQNARTILYDLLEIYWKGLQEQVLFFPNSSYAWAEAIFAKEKAEDDALNAARNSWEDPAGNFSREGDDPYNKRIIDGCNILDNKGLSDSFIKISRKFWQPYFALINQTRES